MGVRARIVAFATILAGTWVAACGDRRAEDSSTASSALGPNLAAPRTALTPLPAGDSYFPLTGSPPSPLPFNEAGWDVQVYSRDQNTWYAPEAMDAHHATDCGAYPGVHRISQYADMVFRCRDHIMTAVNATGYGAIVLTPDRLLDWTGGEAVLRLDITTLKTSDRDWVNIWISPYGTQLSVPATPFAPGLNGPPRDGLFIEQTPLGNYCPRFVSNFVVTQLACTDWKPLTSVIPASATVRNTLEIRVTRTHVVVSMPNEGVMFADVNLPAALPFTQGVVQFGHYSYNPTKCSVACVQPPMVPNTWHWDEIHLAPSAPFTILRGNARYVDGGGGTVTFPAPAPASSRLRFFAAGIAPEVSFDDGVTWQKPAEQTVSVLKDPERQYWSAVPQGTLRVKLRPAKPITWWPGQNWMARDFAIWAPITSSIAFVNVSLGLSAISVGQTTTAVATTLDANNTVITGQPITWSTSDPTIATVSSNGVVMAVAAGTVSISATSGGKSGSATLTVSPASVGSVSVTLAATTLTVGQTTSASSIVRDANNAVLTGWPIVWSTSNAAIATVSPSGAVTAVAAGAVSITATSGGKSGSATLTVSPPTVGSVSVTVPTSTLTVGQSVGATAIVRDAVGTVMTSWPVTWTTSNASIATVSTNGLVSAVGAGIVTITASSGGRSGSAGITVSLAPVAGVAVALPATSLDVGQSLNATATLRDASNNVLTGRAVVWTSSNPALATVSPTGVVTALAVGNVTITATSGGVSGSASLNVIMVPVARVVVVLSSNVMTVGQVLTATSILYDAAGNVLLGRDIDWGSADRSIARALPPGVVTALAPGVVTIRAASGGVVGSATLTVR